MGSLMLWGPNSCRISPGRQQEGEGSSWNPGAPAPRASLVSSWPGQELSMSTRVSEGIFPRGGISYDCVFCSFPTWFSWAGWGEAFLGKSSKAAAFPGGSWAFLTSCWEHFGNVFWVGKVLSPLQVLFSMVGADFTFQPLFPPLSLSYLGSFSTWSSDSLGLCTEQTWCGLEEDVGGKDGMR